MSHVEPHLVLNPLTRRLEPLLVDDDEVEDAVEAGVHGGEFERDVAELVHLDHLPVLRGQHVQIVSKHCQRVGRVGGCNTTPL